MHKKIFILFFINFSFIHNNSFAADKIAYMDMNFIINNSNIGQKVLKQLNDINKNNIENLRTEQKKLKIEIDEINKIRNIGSDDDIKKKIDIHNKNIKSYENLKKKLAQDLNNERNEEMNKIVKLINPLLEDYMKNNSIDIILRKDVVFFCKDKYDISKNILELTNKTYK